MTMAQEEGLFYRVRCPEGQIPERGFPLLVLLHGYGSNEEDLMGLSAYLDARFLLVSIRAPYALDMGGFAWFSLDFTAEKLVPDLAQAHLAQAQLIEVLDELKREYSIDLQRVYLLGFSQGASMAVGAGLRIPELVAGLVSLSGYCPAEIVPEETLVQHDGLPLLMTHGLQDPVISITQGRASRDVLACLPLALDYREYPMGHEINMACLQDVSAWLVQQLDKKNKKT